MFFLLLVMFARTLRVGWVRVCGSMYMYVYYICVYIERKSHEEVAMCPVCAIVSSVKLGARRNITDYYRIHREL
jgi:hypothetical protein